jgi:hypothetical protein
VKVAHVLRKLEASAWGGTETHVAEVARRLTRHAVTSEVHAPYGPDDALPEAFAAHAVKRFRAFAPFLGDGEIEVGKVTEPWDLGVMAAPENAPLHFLLIDKADKDTEAGGRSAKLKAELTRLATEMTKAGVLQRSHTLQPSAKAKRLFFRNNDLRVVDGPFAESKELLGGFSVMDLESFDEVIALSRRYAEILGGTLEMDVRLVETDT